MNKVVRYRGGQDDQKTPGSAKKTKRLYHTGEKQDNCGEKQDTRWKYVVFTGDSCDNLPIYFYVLKPSGWGFGSVSCFRAGDKL